ncbi:MAG: MarR family transcriptional regulator [Planctomycetes bacterium]|jgi:DNA-binding MarR family transcriptional regulator|nr:MarR family transcriptional regulator [Planctomycetota bacterium]
MSGQFFELILAVKRKCQRNEEQIQQELGLCQAEFNALIVLRDEAQISGCEFAERMALSPSRGSRVLDRLVNDGYAEAATHAQDRRAVAISLTPRGRQTRQRIIEEMEACESRMCGRLDQENVGQIKRALELLDAVM